MGLFSRAPKAPPAPPPRKALVIGEALIDVVRRADGEVSEHPGGSPANVALGLGRLGREVELLTCLSHDGYGGEIQRWLRNSNVELVPGSDRALATSLATATLDDHGDATYSFDFTWELPVDVEISPDTHVVHTGSLAATQAPGAEDTFELFASLQPQATLTYDANPRPRLMGTSQEAWGKIRRFIELADVIKLSKHDLEWLLPAADPTATAQQWLEDGAGLVFITRGRQGATVYSRQGALTKRAPSVSIVDTVGAGDAFMSAIIDGLWTANLLGRENREKLDSIDLNTLSQIIDHCIKVSVKTLTRAGANPPRKSDLL